MWTNYLMKSSKISNYAHELLVWRACDVWTIIIVDCSVIDAVKELTAHFIQYAPSIDHQHTKHVPNFNQKNTYHLIAIWIALNLSARARTHTKHLSYHFKIVSIIWSLDIHVRSMQLWAIIPPNCYLINAHRIELNAVWRQIKLRHHKWVER